jgi:hypothetical protein
MYPALMVFIEIRARQYIEPQRGRRQKGEKVGFPRKKYLATLYELYDVTAAEIAERVNDRMQKGTRKTTEKIISVWRSQEDYKEAVKNHGEEFVEKIKPKILTDWAKANKGEEVKLSSMFADKHLWSSDILIPLFNWATTQSPKFARMVLLVFGRDKQVTEYLAGQLPQWLGWCEQELMAPALSAKSKKEMLGILDLARLYISKTARQKEEK